MRHIRQLAAGSAAAAIVLTGGAVASAATANHAAPTTRHAATVALRGGHTSVTTGTGIATALLGNGIVPIAVGPGREWLKNLSKPAVELSFPVSGGRVSLSPLGGSIDHSGGILFFDTKTGKDIEVSNFVISLKHADLTGIVNGDAGKRVVLFSLSLAHARLRVHGTTVTASDIRVTLSGTAASALDSSLGTKLFTPGLALGTAYTELRI